MKKIVLKIMTILIFLGMVPLHASPPEQVSFLSKASQAVLPLLEKARTCAHVGLEKMRDNLGWATLAAVWGTTQIGVFWWYKRLAAEKKREIAQLEKQEEEVKSSEQQIISQRIHQDRIIRSLQSKINQLGHLTNPHRLALLNQRQNEQHVYDELEEGGSEQVLDKSFLETCSLEKQRLEKAFNDLVEKRKKEIAEYCNKKEALQTKINKLSQLCQNKQQEEYDLSILEKNKASLLKDSKILQEKQQAIDCLEKQIDTLNQAIEREQREVNASDRASGEIIAELEQQMPRNDDGSSNVQRIERLKADLNSIRGNAWKTSFALTVTASMFVLGGFALSKLSGYLASKV